MYNWQNLALLLAGLINLAMSMFVLGRGMKNKVNLFFSLLAFFNFLWAGSLFVSRLWIIEWEIWAKVTYIWALGIVVALFYFTYYYPVVIYKLNKYFHFLNIIIVVYFLIIILFGNIFFISMERNQNLYPYLLLYNNKAYIFYSFYFIILSFVSLLNLFKKICILDLIYKKQTIIISVTLFIGLIFGIYFDLIICYFGNFSFNWFGPLFTFFMNLVVFIFIISSKEKISN